MILSAPKETKLFQGTSIEKSKSRFYYDNNGLNTAPLVGNLTKQEVRDTHNSQWLATTNAYDTFGNVTSTTDPRNNTTTFVYDAATKAQPAQITVNPLNGTGTQTTSLVYDFWTGSVTSQTDPNQKTTTMSYHNHLLGSTDPFGRPGTVTAPLVGSTVNGATTNHQRKVETLYHDSQRMVEVWSDLNAGGDMKLRSRATTDKLGRTVKTETSENGSAYTISTQAVYHQAGRITMSRNPYRGAGGESTDGWTRTTADDIGRVVEVATFNGAAQPPISGGSWNGRVTTSYTGIYTTVTDQAGKVRRSLVDGLGRLIEIHEPDASGNLGSLTSPVQKTSYLYDVLDNLIQVNQGSQQRLFTYDSLSRLRTAKNPEQVNSSQAMVATTYNYDDAGNLTSKLNPNGTSITFTYDGLNRVKTKTLSTGEAYTYNYDTGTSGKGRMVSVVRQGSSDGYYYDGYDALGRVTASRQVTTAGGATRTYTMSYGYDLAGDMTKEVYPSGKEYRMSYDDAGRISNASRYISGVFDKTYASQFSYTPHGAMSQMSLGNGLWEHMVYNSRLQPERIGLGAGPGSISVAAFDYTYGTSNNNGNVQTQEIKIGATTIKQTYLYDSLNRLSSASEAVGAQTKWTQTYGYDRFGNRTSLVNTGSEGGLLPTQGTPGINAATNRLVGFGYDDSGNVLNDGLGNTFTYDAENHQVTHSNSASGQTQYVYDGTGRRVKRENGGDVTVFVYNAGGQLVAEYTSGNAATNGTSYLTSDHLGSTRIVTAQDGSVKTRRDYLPFGEELGAGIGSRTTGMGYDQADGIRQQFTGYEKDVESGLDYAQARYYSSVQGRFTSFDPLIASARSIEPQSWNRYSYVINNPLKYTDPTGLDWWYRTGLDSATPEWHNSDPGEGYKRWTDIAGYVYQDSSGTWWALNPYEQLAYLTDSSARAEEKFSEWVGTGGLIGGTLAERDWIGGFNAGASGIPFADWLNALAGYDTTSREYQGGLNTGALAGAIASGAGGVIRNLTASSRAVALADKAIERGATSVTVNSADEAAEVFLHQYQGGQGPGYRNTTGMTGNEVRNDRVMFPNGKAGTYHWDLADTQHGGVPHLQVHRHDGTQIRIFFKVGS